MRNLYGIDHTHVQRNMDPTIVLLFGGLGDESNGCFTVRKMSAQGILRFRVIASCGDGWEHVSVSLPNRCPTWNEMAWIAGLFFEPEETLVQFRPPASEYVNQHPHCLHWWKPIGRPVVTPPMELVG